MTASSTCGMHGGLFGGPCNLLDLYVMFDFHDTLRVQTNGNRRCYGEAATAKIRP